jgi:hypothetical protein
MKLIVGLVGAVFVFFAAPSFSQVTITEQTAQYFLEADDERHILREKDSLNTQSISEQQRTISLQRGIITTYKTDSVSYAQVIQIKNWELNFKDEQIKANRREIRKLKFHKIAIATVGGLLILVLL